MKKVFMGVKLRRLRDERGLTQAALAQALGISTSYLNQIEQNQRPLTVAVLLKIHRALGVDIQQFSEDEQARLIASLREALVDAPEPISLPELQEVATQMPALGRALLALHRRHQDALDKLEALALQLGDGRGGSHQDEAADDSAKTPTADASRAGRRPAQRIAAAAAGIAAPRTTPFEAVRDFFYAHQNHFDAIDRAAEALAEQARQEQSAQTSAHHASSPFATPAAANAQWLARRLAQAHGITVLPAPPGSGSKRRFDPAARTLLLDRRLDASQRSFQMATQWALIEHAPLLDALTEAAPLAHDEPARRLARIGLANYFAGAWLLPYQRFLAQAQALRYDIDLLADAFGVGFETVCHRLSTLQRPGAPGVPFFFVRVDRAGNISKRQSATHFHFSRTGGTCPLWKVYEAFEQPGRVLTQLASMPDGRIYLWIARTVTRRDLGASGAGGWGAPRTMFSIGLGCDVRHASQLVYSRGLDCKDPQAATPIGMGCKVCERQDCRQRAFPFLGSTLAVDEHHSHFSPYGAA